MTFRIDAQPDDLVEVVLSGTPDAQEWQESADLVLPRLAAGSRLLIDARGLVDPTAAFGGYLRSRWRHDMPGGVRQASVVGPQAAAVARAWRRVFAPAAWGVQAFTDCEEARAWLRQAPQTSSGGS